MHHVQRDALVFQSLIVKLKTKVKSKEMRYVKRVSITHS